MNSVTRSPSPKQITATMLRTKTRDILEEARFANERFLVETFGKPMAVIMGVEDYWDLVQNQVKSGEAAE